MSFSGYTRFCLIHTLFLYGTFQNEMEASASLRTYSFFGVFIEIPSEQTLFVENCYDKTGMKKAEKTFEKNSKKLLTKADQCDIINKSSGETDDQQKMLV